MKPIFVLTDAAERAAKYPDSFHIPSDSELALIKPGDYVKAGFEWQEYQIHQACHSERMWIKVVSGTGKTLTGTVANDPIAQTGVVFGTEVTLEFKNVMAIMRQDVAEVVTNEDINNIAVTFEDINLM